MKILCKIRLDGSDDMHELVTHTTETAADGSARREYTRFLSREGEIVARIHEERAPGLNLRKLTAVLHNGTRSAVRVERYGVTIGIPTKRMRVSYYSSDWGSEFTPYEKDIVHRFSFGSQTGRSTKGFTSWAGLHTDEGYHSMALAWSGNWLFEAERGEDGHLYASMEIHPEGFYIDISPGESFETPALYVSSGPTMDLACLETRRYFKRYLSIVDEARYAPLPLAFNTWWPYEDRFIDENVYRRNAQVARDLGFSYAMMDAGWFGTNADGQYWYDKRGDWEIVNARDFPSGMKALCDGAKAMGIRPGMWCEIEAVGRYAQLNETHPDIIARRDGVSLGYVCFGSERGRAFAMNTVDRILGEYGAKWIKFDFNLDPGAGCNEAGHDHGAGDGLYAHYRGYYAFLDAVHAKYPDVVLENCASGGLRMDIGMLSHTHWTHLSDPDHTEFHLQCYWGALSYLHQSACLHFSWSQILGDHNLGISDPISEDMPRHRFDYMVRAVLTGVPGFSLRLVDLPAWCLERLRFHAEFYTRVSTDFLLRGDAYRLTPQPQVGRRGERFPAFLFVSPTGEGLVFAYRLLDAPERQRLPLQGLAADRTYTVAYQDAGRTYTATGDELMREGLAFEGMPIESSEVVEIR